MKLRLLLTAALLPLAACHAAQGTTPNGGRIAPVTPPAGKMWSEVVSETSDGGIRMGNPDAPIKLLEYGSLSCPHCAHLAQESMAKLTGSYVASGRVSYEYRSFAIHPQDVPLTLLVRCGGIATFFPLVEQVYAQFDPMQVKVEAGLKQAQAAMSLPPQQRLGVLSDALGYTDFFAARGIPAAKAHACLADTTAARAVADHADAYAKAGIDSTPTLAINGSKLPPESATWADIEAQLQRDGAR